MDENHFRAVLSTVSHSDDKNYIHANKIENRSTSALFKPCLDKVTCNKSKNPHSYASGIGILGVRQNNACMPVGGCVTCSRA